MRFTNTAAAVDETDPRSAVVRKAPETSPEGDDDLIGLFVHDLRSPLAAIAMNLDFARSELPQGEAFDGVTAAMDDCRIAAARAFRLISDMADISRYESGRLGVHLATFDLAPLFERVLKSQAPEASCRDVTVTLSGDAPDIRADRDLIERAFECLVEESIRMTPQRGRVEVRISSAYSHGLAPAARDARPLIRIEIAHEGPALPMALRNQMFTRPRREKGKRASSGLGVYFARIAVEALGGSVIIEDDAELGERFVATLPR